MRIFENGTAGHNSGFPAQGQVWDNIIIHVWARCVLMCPCVVRYFFEKKTDADPHASI